MLEEITSTLESLISQNSMDIAEKWLISFLTILATLFAIIVFIVLLALHTVSPRRFLLQTPTDPPGHEGIGEVIRTRLLDELRTARKEAQTLTEMDGANAGVPKALLALPEKWKWIEPIFNRLIAPRHFVVTATPLRADCEQVGLHIQIGSSTGTVLEARQFAEAPISKSTGDRPIEDRSCVYRSLSITAGSWLAFMLTKRSRSRRHAHEPVVLFGTDSWESYAMMRHGVHSNGSVADKRKWHNAALWEDHRNIGALFELAKLDSLDFNPEASLKHGIRHIELAHDLLAGDWRGLRMWLKPFQHSGTRVDPRWYQATYSLAVHCANRYCALSDISNFAQLAREDLARSLELATELTQAIGATQLTLASPWRKFSVERHYRHEISDLLKGEALDLATVLILPLSCEEELHEHLKERRRFVCEFHTSYRDVNWSHDSNDLWKFFSTFSLSGSTAVNVRKFRIHTQDLLDIQDHWVTAGLPHTREALLTLPWKLRYQRACALVRVGRMQEAINLFVQIFDHAASIPPLVHGKRSGSEIVTWALNDPMLEPLHQMLDHFRSCPALMAQKNAPAVQLVRLLNADVTS